MSDAGEKNSADLQTPCNGVDLIKLKNADVRLAKEPLEAHKVLS